MQLAGSTALVTGANRGLGRHFAQQLLDRGAIVYAASRNADHIDVPGVIPIVLDVTDRASVRSAAQATTDVSVLINNAGSSTGASLTDGSWDDIRLEMDTHYYGTLAVTRAFSAQLASAGTSAILNVLSVASWFQSPGFGAYAAAKAAEWSLTNALRLDLAEQGTRVSALHVGYIDTDMVREIDAPKSDPAVVAARALDGVEAGEVEILADELSREVRAGLAGGVRALYPQFA